MLPLYAVEFLIQWEAYQGTCFHQSLGPLRKSAERENSDGERHYQLVDNTGVSKTKWNKHLRACGTNKLLRIGTIAKAIHTATHIQMHRYWSMHVHCIVGIKLYLYVCTLAHMLADSVCANPYVFVIVILLWSYACRSIPDQKKIKWTYIFSHAFPQIASTPTWIHTMCHRSLCSCTPVPVL